MRTCATTTATVPITGTEYIDDVYEHILRYAESGQFIYERWEDAPQWRRDVTRGHVMRFIKRNELCTRPDHPARRFVTEKFPQYWAEALVLHANNLL